MLGWIDCCCERRTGVRYEHSSSAPLETTSGGTPRLGSAAALREPRVGRLLGRFPVAPQGLLRASRA